MRGIAMENWSSEYTNDVILWLTSTFGPTNKKTWYIDYDFDFMDLLMEDNIYLLFKLQWP